MRIVLAGASGLIGSALAGSLRTDGHAVTSLVRREPASGSEVRWQPERGKLDRAAIADSDAVVCLSGAGIASRWWTASYKATLLSSRIDSVGTLARTMADLPSGPRVLLAASAVGYYGDTGEHEVDESAPRGSDFVSGLCTEWEAAAAPAQSAGIRVAHLRSGIVLSPRGGMLSRLKPLALVGLAGRMGSGRQFIPWISLADEVAAIRFVLDNDLAGPVNLTAPAPARNVELMTILARLLHRPAVIPAPAFALRIVLGELAQSILTGQRAVPAKLVAARFTHRHADLESALRWALSR